MNIIQVVTDGVFPITALPDAAVAATGRRGGFQLGIGDAARKSLLDPQSARRILVVALRQSPDAVEMIWQRDPGVDVKRRGIASLLDACAQQIDPPNQYVGSAVAQIHGKKVATTRNAIAAVIRHGKQLLGES